MVYKFVAKLSRYLSSCRCMEVSQHLVGCRGNLATTSSERYHMSTFPALLEMKDNADEVLDEHATTTDQHLTKSVEATSETRLSNQHKHMIEEDKESQVAHQVSPEQEAWLAKAQEFCEKTNISDEKFIKLCQAVPVLKRLEKLQHFSDVADVLEENGFGSGVKLLLTKFPNKFSQTEISHLRFLLNKHTEEIEQGNGNVLEQFPFELLDQISHSYSDITDFLAETFHVDSRVADACWHSKANWRKQIPLYRGRVELLENNGIRLKDILEHSHLITRCKTEQLVKVIEEQETEFGKINISEVSKYFLSSYSKPEILKTLSVLFGCGSMDFTSQEKECLKNKGKVNVATVFYMLIDEGFSQEEIRRFVFLLGVEESNIRQYLKEAKNWNSSGRIVDHINSSGEKSVSERHKGRPDNSEEVLPEIGAKFKSHGAFSHLSAREKFLQKMQVALEVGNLTDKVQV